MRWFSKTSFSLVQQILKGWYITDCYLLHDERPFHTQSNPLICRENQWTGFQLYDKNFRHERVNENI